MQQGQQQQIIQQIFQERQSQQQQRAENQYECQINLLDFKKYAPPAFSGTSDPMEAESWLKTIEKVFHALRCPAEDKVTFATFMLQGEAADWWEIKIGKMGPNDVPFTWEEFRKVFYEKYFPQSIRLQKFREFDRLIQSHMTVAQYAVKFEELSRYAPALKAEENVRARKFENGLRERIQQLVTVFELPTYKEVINKCLIIEKRLNDAQAAREKSMKKRGRAIDSQGQSSRAFKPKILKPSQTTVESKAQSQGSIICYRCGGPHLKRDCTWPGRQCYKCGRDGHKAVVCRSGGESQRQQMPQNFQNTPTNRAPQDVQGQDVGQQKSKTQAISASRRPMTIPLESADQTISPSGVNATYVTEVLCPESVPKHDPSLTLQILTVISLDADAMYFPHGEKHALFTAASCPARDTIIAPVFASQTSTNPPFETDSTSWPSSENLIAQMKSE